MESRNKMQCQKNNGHMRVAASGIEIKNEIPYGIKKYNAMPEK